MYKIQYRINENKKKFQENTKNIKTQKNKKKKEYFYPNRADIKITEN